MKLIVAPATHEHLAVVLDCGCVLYVDLTMNTKACTGEHE